MKILAPLSQIDNYEKLVEAGADEFFAGIFPYEWLKKYNSVLPINRREYIFGNCNISSMSSMRSLAKMVEKYGISIKVAFNAHYFLPEQYDMVLDTIKRLMDLGYTTFILSDIALIIYLREKGIDCIIHISGELQVSSEYLMRFLNQFNVSRYIFPRRESIPDMRETIQNSGLNDKEYEAFILNSFCPYDGAFCNAIHCDELQHICWIKAQTNTFESMPKRFLNEKEKLRHRGLQSMQYHDDDSDEEGGCEGCGLCAVKKLEEIGITNLKVVGRGIDLESVVRDVKMVRDVVDASKTISDKNEFEQYVKDKYFNGNCSNRLCYYPDNF